METLKIPLSELSDHPLQGVSYAPLQDHIMDRLRESMGTKGMRDPIVVMPPANAAGLEPYTILDGHQRRDAAEQLGWDEVPVRVRDDLVDADEQTVTEAFYSYNDDRRQLDPLDQTLVYIRRQENKAGRAYQRMSSNAKREIDNAVASMLGMSLKNARRYIDLALGHVALQNAYQAGDLKLELAARAARLRDEEQQEIADVIEAGETSNLNAHVKERLPKLRKRKPKDTLGSKIQSICDAATSFQDEHGDRIGSITHPSWRQKFLQRIAAAKAVVNQLADQLESIDPDADPLAGLADLLKGRNGD